MTAIVEVHPDNLEQAFECVRAATKLDLPAILDASVPDSPGLCVYVYKEVKDTPTEAMLFAPEKFVDTLDDGDPFEKIEALEKRVADLRRIFETASAQRDTARRLLLEWQETPFFHSKALWREWHSEFSKRVDDTLSDDVQEWPGER